MLPIEVACLTFGVRLSAITKWMEYLFICCPRKFSVLTVSVGLPSACLCIMDRTFMSAFLGTRCQFSFCMAVAPIKSKPHDAFDGAILLCMWHALRLSVQGPKAHWKHVACSLLVREWQGKVYGTGCRWIRADWSYGQLKKGQTKWQTLQFQWVFCSFVWLCYVNSKLTLTAVGRNSLRSLSECESITTRDTTVSVGAEVISNQTHFDSSRETQFMLTVKSVNPSPHGTPLYLSGEK